MAEEGAPGKGAASTLDRINNDVGKHLEGTMNMKTFMTYCKDPSKYANYPACEAVCHDQRMSVTSFNMG
eukprot:2461428-Amphidinium_carterae.1